MDNANVKSYVRPGDELIVLATLAAEVGLEPNPYGETIFTIEGPPASIQSGRDVKKEFIDRVRGVLSRSSFVLSGEVHLEVTWFIHERVRFETDKSPDVDNILKPLIDALCGPQGVLIDDCQLTSVFSQWIDWGYAGREQLKISLKHQPDEFRQKDGLFFVQYRRGLCYPFNLGYGHDALLELIKHFDERLDMSEKIDRVTPGEPMGFLTQPVQRPLHRTRVQQFPVTLLADAVRNMEAGRPPLSVEPSPKES